MGKRTGQLAGLAALGALGYMLSQDKKGGNASVDTRSFSPNMAPEPAAVDLGDDRDIGGGFNPASMRSPTPVGPAALRSKAGEQLALSPVKPGEYVPRDAQEQRAQRALLDNYVPRDAQEQRAQRATLDNYVPRDAQVQRAQRATLDNYVPRDYSTRGQYVPRDAQVQRAQRDTINNYVPRDYSTRSATRAVNQTPVASAINQIPTDSGLYRTVTGGEPVTGNELTRNINNTLSALTPLGGGFGKVGAELVTAKGAAERAAKARDLAEAARRAKPATTLKSSASTAPARANQAAKSGRKKFNEDEAGIDFKRGGKTKKMASGGLSASRRGDGIAMRGKTRGKLY